MYDPDQYALYCWFRLLEHDQTPDLNAEDQEIDRVCTVLLSEVGSESPGSNPSNTEHPRISVTPR